MTKASKAEAGEVSSHFVIVQEKIDHIQQQAEEIPNRQALHKGITDWPVHGDNAVDGQWGQSSDRYTEHDDHVPQEMQVTVADRSSLRLTLSSANLNSTRGRAHVRKDQEIRDDTNG